MGREENQSTYVSKKDIKNGLKKLGLKKGDIVCVHSSLSSFGYVEGGADTVIDALLEIVGDVGTIVMPTYSNNRIEVEKSPEETEMGVTWKYKILPFNSDEASCWTGILPETFRKRNGVLRSLHPTHSIAALGSKSREIVEPASQDPQDGWRKLLGFNAYILLIGVNLDSCSSMHLVEDRVKLPNHILDKITPPKWLVEKYPEGEWDFGFGPYPDFLKMEEPCLEHSIMRKAKVGKAILKLVRLEELIDLFEEYMKRDPDQFYRT